MIALDRNYEELTAAVTRNPVEVPTIWKQLLG